MSNQFPSNENTLTQDSKLNESRMAYQSPQLVLLENSEIEGGALNVPESNSGVLS